MWSLVLDSNVQFQNNQQIFTQTIWKSNRQSSYIRTAHASSMIAVERIQIRITNRVVRTTNTKAINIWWHNTADKTAIVRFIIMKAQTNIVSCGQICRNIDIVIAIIVIKLLLFVYQLL